MTHPSLERLESDSSKTQPHPSLERLENYFAGTHQVLIPLS
jgi:hypothetical protein